MSLPVLFCLICQHVCKDETNVLKIHLFIFDAASIAPEFLVDIVVVLHT